MLSILAAILAGAAAQAQPIFDANNDAVADTIQFFPDTADLLVRSGANNDELWRALKPACVSSTSQSFVLLSDVSGDTVLDIAVCRPKCPTTAPFLGEVELLSGTNGATVWTLAGTSTTKFTGVLLRVSDQTTDGVPELIASVEGDPQVRTVLIDGVRGVILDSFSLGISELAIADEAGVRLFSPGDVDQNGLVNSDDLDILVDWYSGEDPRADIDGDGSATYYDIDLLVAEMNAGVVTIRGVLAVSGQNNSCTTGFICECNNSDNVPIGAGASTSGTCGAEAAAVTIVMNCSNPTKPTASFSGVPEEGPNGQPVLVQVCTTYEFLDGSGWTIPLNGLLPQNTPGSTFDTMQEHPGMWRVTVVVAWCVDGGWCCKKASCDLEVTQDPNTTNPCAGGSGCSYDPGELKGLPQACPLLGGDGTQQNPTLVVPGQVFNLWFEGETQIIDYESLCAQQSMDNPDFPGEFIHTVTTTGPIETFVTDSCTWQRNMFRVMDEALAGDAITITINIGYSLCAVNAYTLYLQVSPDSDQDMLLDCYESFEQCPYLDNPDSDSDGLLDGEEYMLALLHLDAGECRDPEYLFDINATCGGSPPFEFDHDRDGISDILEVVRYHSNPLGFDTDRDGIQDLAEVELYTILPTTQNPNGAHSNIRVRDGGAVHITNDADRDGIYDTYELSHGWDTTSSDQDGDGIRDGLEMIFPGLGGPEVPDQGPAYPGTNTDTDNDGLSDRVELLMGLRVNDPDSDNDGVPDGAEAAMGYDPTKRDSDGDGIPDGQEDFDGDGYSNIEETYMYASPTQCDAGHNEGLPSCMTCNAGVSFGRNILFRCGSFTGPSVANGRLVSVNSESGTLPLIVFPLRIGEELQLLTSELARECDGAICLSEVPWEPVDCGDTLCGSCCRAVAGQMPNFGCGVHAYLQDLSTTTHCGQPRIRENRWKCQLPDGIRADIDGDGIDETADVNGDGVVDINDDPLIVQCTFDENIVSDSAGIVMFASVNDSDADDIPDFADGYNYFDQYDVPSTPNVIDRTKARDLDTTSPHRRNLQKMTVQLGGLVLPRFKIDGTSLPEQHIVFQYAGSDPQAVQIGADGAFHPDGNGNLRLWFSLSDATPHDSVASMPPGLNSWIAALSGWGLSGDAEAMPEHCSDTEEAQRARLEGGEGMYIIPGHIYRLDELGILPQSKQINLYVEAVAHSPTLGQSITATVSTAGFAPAPVIEGMPSSTSEVKVTALEMKYVPINDDGSTGASMNAAPISHPTPVLTSQGLEVTNLRVDPNDPRKLLADLRVHGTVDDAVCDLTPGEPGRISSLFVLLNEEPLPSPNGNGDLVLPVSVEKVPIPSSATKPFDFTGYFDSETILNGVEVQPGTNRLRIMAMNPLKFSGWLEWSFTIDVFDPDPIAWLAEVDANDVNLEGEEGETLTLRIVSPPLAGDPNAWIERDLAWTGNPFEFEDENLRVVVIATEFDSESADVIAIDMYEYGADDPSRTVALLETDDDSEVFVGLMPISVPSGGTFEGSTFQVSTQREISSTRSEDGLTQRFMIQFIGPEPNAEHPTPIEVIRECFDNVTIGDRTYRLTTYQGSVVLKNQLPDYNGPAALMAVPSRAARPLDSHPSTQYAGRGIYFDSDAFVEFMDGFGEGLLDSGTDFIDGAVSLVKGVWSFTLDASDYVYASWLEFKKGDTTVVRKDLRELGVRIGEGFEKFGSVAEVVWNLYNDSPLFFDAVVLRQEEAIERLNEDYGVYFEMASDLIDALKELKDSMTDHQRGWVAGRITGEILVQVGQEVATAGLASGMQAVQKSEKLVALAQKLSRREELLKLFKFGSSARNAGTVSRVDRAGVAIGEVLVRAQRVISSRACFVAGTPVWTSRGQTPIEAVTAGDMVLSRDVLSGEMAWKPVLQTFTTHPAALATVRFAASSAGESVTDTFTGTLDHPVWVRERDAFVPLAEVRPGESFELFNKTAGKVLSVTTTRGPPLGPDRSLPNPSLHGWNGSTFTTYNLEVADFHSYFVGKAGVWVHNRAPFCQRVVNKVFKRLADPLFPTRASGRPNYLGALREQVTDVDIAMRRRWVSKHPGVTPRTIDGVPEWDINTQKLRRNIILGVSDDAATAGVSAGNDFRHLHTYDEFNEFFEDLPDPWKRGSIPRGGGHTVIRRTDDFGTRIELPGLNSAIHHGSPSKVTQGIFSDAGLPFRNQDWLDANVPCVPLEIPHHNMFHTFLGEEMADIDPSLLGLDLAREKRLAINRAYSRLSSASDGPGAIASDYGKLIDEWLKAQGVP